MKIRFFVLLTAFILIFCMFGACDTDNDKTNTDGQFGNQSGDQSGDRSDDEPSTYTITWKDENGNTLSTVTVNADSVPSYSYSKNNTAEWSYTFDGWSLTQDGEILTNIPKATADAVYYAKITATKRSYTVTFITNGGSEVATQTVEYGSVPTVPDNPKYEGYRFTGWYSDTALKTAVDFTEKIVKDTYYYAAWNEQIDIPALLEALLESYSLNPYSYIPDSMKPDFSAKLVSATDVNKDYSDFVKISDISAVAHGEQWQMVIENLNQSETFFSLLSVVEDISAVSVAAFNNYFDENPSDTAHHSFASGIYNVTVDFDGEIIYYVLDYTANIPLLGEQSVQIAISMDISSTERNVRIQIGDANALIYTIAENSYEFAIKYLGVRRAYFSVSKNDKNEITGHIYEYLTLAGLESASAADFYINDEYISVVGNKADGFVGFTGYISELYDTDSGLMIGYEVQETTSLVTFNTLWFDLKNISGITSIKYVTNEDETTSFYINGLSTAWENKLVGGLSLKTASRRYDIEFRTRYYYVYDSETETYSTVSVKIPMLFVQEENYKTLSSDIKEKNNVTVSVTVNETDLSKLKTDYSKLIPDFIQNKDLYTIDRIIEIIGDRVYFESEEQQ